jgi:hypothetical protein
VTSILAAFSLHSDACSDLDALERRFVARRPRRAGRMTRMACVGASCCLARLERKDMSGESLGVFHGTALGNMVETRKVVRQVVEEPEYLPSPIVFSCSMSNMSSFFVAQATGARGPNLLVSQAEFSFEGALLSAVLSTEVGECEHALVGATDVRLASREENIEALGYAADSEPGEGSGWLLLGPESAGAPGALLHVELPGPDIRDVAATILDLAHADEPLRILPGPGITADDGRILRESLPRARIVPYLDRTGLYPTAAAAGLAALFEVRGRGGLFAHVGINGNRQSSLTLVRVHPA